MIRTYPYTCHTERLRVEGFRFSEVETLNQANFTSKAVCLGLLEDDFGERFLWPLGFAVLRF